MPPAQLRLTQELEKQIATAENMHNLILVTSPPSIKMDTDIKQIAGAYFSLAVEHQASILILLRQNRRGSALALMRPFVEAVFCGHWMIFCSKPQDIKKLKKHKSPYPEFPKMADEVESVAKTSGLFSSIKKEIKALHGYTHGGMEQLARRFDSKGNLSANYSDDEASELIRSSVAYLALFAVTWCQLISNDNSPTEPRSKAIIMQYMKLYPAPVHDGTSK
jgi:hypothetical protein